MPDLIKSSWLWLIDGLTDALDLALERLRPAPVFIVKMEERSAVIRSAAGAELARLSSTGDGADFVPQSAAYALAGAAVEVEIPAAWALRRELNPIAAENAAYAEAFARHQIERVTPWRASDVYVRVATAPLDGDSTRLSVSLDVVARRLVEPVLRALTTAAPAQLRLLTRRAGIAEPIVIPTGAVIDSARKGRRSAVQGVLVALAASFTVLFATAALRIGDLRGEVDALDAQIENLRTARLSEKSQGETGPNDDLRLRKQTRVRAVATLEALSATLPDEAYLVDFTLEGDRLKISGVSTAAADLAPTLERSGHFVDVAFSGATTREESGARDKFHLEMRVKDAAKGGPR